MAGNRERIRSAGPSRRPEARPARTSPREDEPAANSARRLRLRGVGRAPTSQLASKETEPWRSEPFRFTKEGDTYLGRGTTDDKGPALTALLRRARGDRGGRAGEHPLPVGARGGGRLAELRADAEGDRPGGEDRRRRRVGHGVGLARPALALGRACGDSSGSRFHLETAETDQHSGTTGGAARNPVAELAQLASEIFDAKTGRVKVPGFYDDVEKLTAAQIKDFKAAGFDVKGFIEDHGFKSIRTKDPLEVMKRIWALPTFEVHGLVGGYSGPGVKTIVPPRAELKVLGAPRPEDEGRDGGPADQGVREEAPPRRAGRGVTGGAGLQGHHERPLRRGGQALDPVRLRQGRPSSCARAARSAPCCRWSRS